AEDAFFVAGDDARAEDDRVAFVDARVLMVVNGSAAERAHGLALGSADEHHELIDRIVLHLPGIDDQPGGDVDVAKILRNLSALNHRPAYDADLALMLARQFHGDSNAVNRR